MTAIEIKLLGPFEIRDLQGRALTINAKKNRALVAALALAPGHTLTRERMVSLLWSDRGATHSRSSLRHALRGLRADLAAASAPVVDITDEKASLRLEHVGIDVLEFQRLAASSDVSALRRADSLFRGELLADTYVQDSTFEEWIDAERRRLVDLAVHVVERICMQESGAARIASATRLVALDHLREGSHRLLMQAHLDAGERALALRQYELCRDILRDELQISPGDQTEALRRLCMATPSPLRPLGNSVSQISNGQAAHTHAAGPAAPREDSDRPLVAVLPLQPFSSDPEVENFCDGLTEDIITGLSRVAALRVVARSTMFTFKHRAVDIREVGRDLGARYVLEGSVRSTGENTRVVAQLIDGGDGHHIWADQFDRANGEMFGMQNDITRSVVASVQVQIVLNEGKAGDDDDQHAKASRLLARAWRSFVGLTEESLAECKALAERALELEPRNAAAHRMMAAAIYHQIYMGLVPWTRQAIGQLYAHARKSIESDGADEYCHWSMECAYLLRGEHELARASLKRALEINPNFALGHGSMGTVLAWSGDHDRSVQSNELALNVNPQDPSNFFRHFGLALAHYLAGRTEEAISHGSRAVYERPNWWLGQLVYAASLVQGDRLENASRVVAELSELRPDIDASQVALLPFAKAADRQRFSQDLRLAGLM